MAKQKSRINLSKQNNELISSNYIGKVHRNNNTNEEGYNLNAPTTISTTTSVSDTESEESVSVAEVERVPRETNQINDDRSTQEERLHAELEDQKSIFIKVFGFCLIFMTISSFLFIGLIINCLQFILIITINFSSNKNWKRFHKHLNGQLIYIMFCPPIFLLYYWNRVELNINAKNNEMMADIHDPMLAIMITNHTYELDYMIYFVLADQLGNIGSYKTLSKDELKYLPIVGWSLWMSDIIFVKRNWSKDREIIKSKLEDSFYYDQLLISIFGEGTRWTKEKYEISKNFSLSRGLEPLKYHLEPRPRGFSYIIRYYLKEIYQNKRKDPNLFKIYNLQIMMSPALKFRHFIYGTKLTADVYCEPIKLSEEFCNEVLKQSNQIDDEDDRNCTLLNDLLRKIYERKDEIVDEYKKNNNKYPTNEQSGKLAFRTKKTPLIIWLIGFIITYSIFGYLAITVYARSLTFWTIVVSYATSCAYMFKRFSNESHANNNIISDNSRSLKKSNSSNNDPIVEEDSISIQSYCKDVDKSFQKDDNPYGVRRSNNKIKLDNTSPC